MPVFKKKKKKRFLKAYLELDKMKRKGCRYFYAFFTRKDQNVNKYLGINF